MMNKYSNFLQFLIALSLGVLLTFSFAPYDIFPLAIIAPAGLCALLLNASPRKAFGLGYFFGLGLFGAGVYWVFISIHLFGEIPIFFAILITMGFVAFLAISKGLLCFINTRYFSTHYHLLFTFPVLWVLGELIQARLFTGFPWLFLGYSQIHSPLKGLAPILSVYGVSLATLLTSTFILNAFLQYKKKNYYFAYASLLIIICLWVVASLLNLITWTTPQGKPLSVSLVQGNIPQSIKWLPDNINLSLKRYEQLTEPLWGQDKLIIWPESAIPLPLQEALPFINKMDQKAKQTNSKLILGIPVETNDGKGYLNALITLGNEKNSYFKRHLVPFGEYTPFESLLSGLFHFFNIPLSNILPGERVQDPFILGGVKILTAICYEIAFPWLIQSHDQSLGLLLTVTNDAWFGESAARAQHLQIAMMRALEYGRPELFVSNDGITAIITPKGELQSVAPIHQAIALTGTIQPTQGLTPWMKNGSNPLMIILISLLIFARWSSNHRVANLYH